MRPQIATINTNNGRSNVRATFSETCLLACHKSTTPKFWAVSHVASGLYLCDQIRTMKIALEIMAELDSLVWKFVYPPMPLMASLKLREVQKKWGNKIRVVWAKEHG